MDGAYISAFAALGGSAVGALASFITTWLTLNSQDRANRMARAMTRRENLFSEFIEEAAKLFTDAMTHELDDVSKFVRIYALASKLRLFASADVLLSMDEVMRKIVELYETPHIDLHALGRPEQQQSIDILRAFSEACRRDLDL